MFPFNVRVYGLLVDEANNVLVSDEIIRGKFYTKFPGGGLEFGEGTKDCLAREFMEEANLEVEVTEHLYTTDFFQLSAFNPNHQILSIYYLVKATEPLKFPLKQKPFDFDAAQLERAAKTGEAEVFRMIPMRELTEDDVTLPIDKIAVRLLLERFNRPQEG